MAIDPITGLPTEQMRSEATPDFVQEENAPIDLEQSNVSGEVPIWASEQPVEDIINESEQALGTEIEKVIEKEILTAEAIVLITNIADKQSPEVISDLTTKAIEGYKIDLASRKDWE